MTKPVTLADLKPKEKQPTSLTTLRNWVNLAEQALDGPSGGGRTGWLIASTVVIATLQRAVDAQGTATFLLKGGTMLQHRLGNGARATKDVDGLIRGDLEEFLKTLDDALAEPWGPLTFRRSEIETIQAPTRVIPARRVYIYVLFKGQVWRKIQVELSSDEGNAGETAEQVFAPTLSPVGLPTPDFLATMAMRYQIAQKLHACSDPHDPPVWVNDRPRDIVDLVLLRQLVRTEGHPTSTEIREAAEAIFAARAADAIALGRPVRTWPPTATAHPHWQVDYGKAAQAAHLDMTLTDAVNLVNDWITELNQAGISRVVGSKSAA